MSGDLAVVGQRAVKLDAEAKASGRARYVSDLVLPRMLHARLLRSPYPHARVLRVEAAAALALPGVRAVLSSSNLADHFPALPPFDLACHEFEREPEGAALAGDQRLFDATVRYAGEPVAAVVADSDAQARAAPGLIEVEYAELPAVLDVEQAQAEEAPRLHDGAPNNLAGRIARQEGDVDAALADAALVLERRFVTSKQKQAQLEPPCCVVDVGADGKVTVWTPTQAPHRVRHSLARLFGLPLHRVRVVVPPVGGAFGKNDGVIGEPYAVALALLLGRPVKLAFSRREDFAGTESRHPTVTTLTAGFRADGTIAALRARTLVDAGAYLSHSEAVTAVLQRQFLGYYHIPHADLESRIVFTNTPVSGAFRGYGGPQACFALEHLIDLGARALGTDPLAARERMRIRAGDPWGAAGLPMASDGFGECLTRGAQAIDWAAKRARPAGSGTRRRGVGMACVSWTSGTADKPGRLDQSGAIVHVNPDGTLQVLTGASDLGTGLRTALAQICAETFGVPLAAVEIAETDTDVTPYDTGAHASRSLYRAGQAVQAAAADARQELLAYAADQMESDPADLVLREGQVAVRGAPGRGLGLQAMLRRALFEGHDLHGYGEAPRNNAPTFAAQFAEVEVDLETGQVEVLRLVAAQDVGRAINPTLVEGQIEGGAFQGIGYALTEQVLVDGETGTVLNGMFMDYRLLTAVDAPAVEAIVVEQPDPSGPFGAKGVGEPGIIPTAPAIANAILHATGASVTTLPMTPERVLAALRAPNA